MVRPYDQPLATLSNEQFHSLVRRVKRQVVEVRQRYGNVRMKSLCGVEYNKVLSSADVPFEVDPSLNLPVEALRDVLKGLVDATKLEIDLDAAYSVLDRLTTQNGLQPLRDVIRQPMPESGVYLFFDKQEVRLRNPADLRVVRVGTHGVAIGSKASLRHRMRTHLGTAAGAGNHRSSVFRLHVGRSLIRGGLAEGVDSWGLEAPPAGTALARKEAQLEELVSEYVGSLLVTVINVPGDSSKDNDRAYLEQNLIALLSNSLLPLDPPSFRWLGLLSDKKSIQKSGLWNVNHTSQRHTREFLDMLEYYTRTTLGEIPNGPKPVAPVDWMRHAREDQRQFSLL